MQSLIHWRFHDVTVTNGIGTFVYRFQGKHHESYYAQIVALLKESIEQPGLRFFYNSSTGEVTAAFENLDEAANLKEAIDKVVAVSNQAVQARIDSANVARAAKEEEERKQKELDTEATKKLRRKFGLE